MDDELTTLLTLLRTLQERALHTSYPSHLERMATLNILSGAELILQALPATPTYRRVKALNDAHGSIARALRAADRLFLEAELPDIVPIIDGVIAEWGQR